MRAYVFVRAHVKGDFSESFKVRTHERQSGNQGLVQTSNFTCAEPNENEQKLPCYRKLTQILQIRVNFCEH